jgi:hypothetical protein
MVSTYEGGDRTRQWDRLVGIMQSVTKTPAEMMETPGRPADISSHDLSQFKQPRGKRPKFEHLPWLSVAIGKDPSYLARELGMVPNVEENLVRQRIEAARRLGELEDEVQRLERSLHRESSEGITAIVARAHETGWAVAVWPSIEGPEDCRLHVSDRLDFTRSDGTTPNPEDLDRDLGDVLRNANAIQGRALPRWQMSPRKGLSWTIQEMLDYRAPVVHTPHPNARSVCVVAHSVTSWASDTASHIALLLGYGLDSTRELNQKINGGARTLLEGSRTGEDVAAARAEIHNNLLQEPRPRYVWYHFGKAIGTTFVPGPDDHWPKGLVVIRIRETDRLIAYRKKSAHEAIEAERERQAVDKVCEKVSRDHLISLDADHPVAADGEELPETERRNLRHLESLLSAAEVVDTMMARGLVSPIFLSQRLKTMAKDSATLNERRISAWMTQRGLGAGY